MAAHGELTVGSVNLASSLVRDSVDIDTLAHEIGHALGIDHTERAGHSRTSTGVMGYKPSGAPLRKQVRRYDWNVANPQTP
jgi:hypothetical protein